MEIKITKMNLNMFIQFINNYQIEVNIIKTNLLLLSSSLFIF